MENECLICNLDIHLVGYDARLCASSSQTFVITNKTIFSQPQTCLYLLFLNTVPCTFLSVLGL